MASHHPEPAAGSTLSVDSVSFNYGSRIALNSVSFSLSAGETAFVLGPNGAGKSTLFSLISGLFRANTGSISIDGALAGSPAALSQLGIVFQSETLDPDLSIRDNLHYYAALHGIPKKEATERIHTALKPFELESRLSEKVRTLNGGHRRRVDIARALLHKPRLLLLDEPTVGLDIPTRTALTERLHSIAKNTQCAVLWATHLADEVHADNRVILLHEGSVRGDDSATHLMNQFGSDSVETMMSALTKANPA